MRILDLQKNDEKCNLFFFFFIYLFYFILFYLFYLSLPPFFFLPQEKKKKNMQKDTRKKNRAYKASMLLKYWKATNKEPVMDLCMIIAVYTQDIDAGSLYAVGLGAAITIDSDGSFNSMDTLMRITLQNKDGEEPLVKNIMNGDIDFRAFLFENGTVRVIRAGELTLDITLESEIIRMNSGNCCDSLFVIDSKMRVYQIKNKTPIQFIGLPDGIRIKDISCGIGFTMFLGECGRVFGMGVNDNGKLGLSRRIQYTQIPIEITFPNKNDSDRNRITMTMIHTSYNGWVAVDYKQRAWIIGKWLMELVRSDYKSLDPCISIVEVWNINDIQITQIKCGHQHVIALDTEERVYWFGRFKDSMPLSHVSLNPISFSHRITLIRSGLKTVACKDATNEWYVWGYNSFNHITSLCGCETPYKERRKNYVISNPMKCEWNGLFDAARVIDLQLGLYKVHVIVDSV